MAIGANQRAIPAQRQQRRLRASKAQESARSFLVYLTASMTCLFVSGAALYGLFLGRFDALASVWTVAGPIVGGLMSYYFSSKRDA